METLISSLSPLHAFAITHASDVSVARRCGNKLAEDLGFDDVKAGRLAIVITEAGTNILKHAGEGMLYVMRAQSGASTPGIDVLAVDAGPGIADLAFSLQDGVSSAGTAGNGLGALKRQSDEFDVWTARGQGAAFFMRVWQTLAVPDPCGIEVGALTVPMAGQSACGDGWAVACGHGGATLVGVDGLGHGPEAAKAAAAAVEALRGRPASGAGEILHVAHEALRGTRGAALSAARVDYDADRLSFAGIGNVAGTVVDGIARRSMVSHSGIVGSNVRKVQEFGAAFEHGALCIMHSDGIQSQWDLSRYPRLHTCAPALVAGILMRDFNRGRDDAMVLVGRRRTS